MLHQQEATQLVKYKQSRACLNTVFLLIDRLPNRGNKLGLPYSLPIAERVHAFPNNPSNIFIYPTHPSRARSISKWSTSGMNSEISFSSTGCHFRI